MVDFIAKRIHHRTFCAWVGRTTLNEEKKGGVAFLGQIGLSQSIKV